MADNSEEVDKEEDETRVIAKFTARLQDSQDGQSDFGSEASNTVSNAVKAVDLMAADQGNVSSGFRKEFADNLPYRSMLQRTKKNLDKILELFDWRKDDAAWCAEYKKEPNDIDKLIKLKRRICFEVCGWREFNEDFGRGDVSCLRDIRTPLVTSESPLKAMKEEFA